MWKFDDLKPLIVEQTMDDPERPNLSRRGFFAAAGAAGVAAAGGLLRPTPVHAQSTDWLQSGNNNHVIALQEATSYPDGALGIEFYGHCAIKITSPGGGGDIAFRSMAR
ncbi:twin-arginine translocation signal domain-containing protein [Celeribacter persicus]|nr:twin-arginine translocation signal domain-containing protein [Celeribacter persicus]